jgi:phosphatidylserine/phosphatidylglycerophosphate/cardiolipin synthase-like enzyme
VPPFEWGYLGDRSTIGEGWRYNALVDLRQLEAEYPNRFKLKLIGTHEKFLICDRSFALLGSHNLLASGIQSAEREVGVRMSDPQVIQGLLTRFNDTVVQELALSS